MDKQEKEWLPMIKRYLIVYRSGDEFKNCIVAGKNVLDAATVFSELYGTDPIHSVIFLYND